MNRKKYITTAFMVLALLIVSYSFIETEQKPNISLNPLLNGGDTSRITVRLPQSPIITEEMLSGEDGASINGPSLIKVPDWISNPLGKYYLYFAHHAGTYIRLAYADRIEGPWHIHEEGVLPLSSQSLLRGHIASPEAVIDEKSHRIYLFYHGPRKSPDKNGKRGQVTCMSVSDDGLNFQQIDRIVGPPYLRVFQYHGQWFAMDHSGILQRASALGEVFEPVARIIGDDITAAVDPSLLGEPGAPLAKDRPSEGPYRYAIRHVGLDVNDGILTVYFSCVGHRPERILCTKIDMKASPETWRAKTTIEVLRPETREEGADLPLAFSKGGISVTRVNELRDPTVFREGGKAYLLYSIAGEHGIGIADLDLIEKVRRKSNSSDSIQSWK